MANSRVHLPYPYPAIPPAYMRQDGTDTITADAMYQETFMPISINLDVRPSTSGTDHAGPVLAKLRLARIHCNPVVYFKFEQPFLVDCSQCFRWREAQGRAAYSLERNTGSFPAPSSCWCIPLLSQPGSTISLLLMACDVSLPYSHALAAENASDSHSATL